MSAPVAILHALAEAIRHRPGDDKAKITVGEDWIVELDAAVTTLELQAEPAKEDAA